MANKKVLFFGISSELGGAEQSLLDFLSLYAKDKNNNFLVLLPKDKGPLVEALKQLNVRVQCLPLPTQFLKASRENFLYDSFFSLLQLPQLSFYLYKLRKFIKNENIDIIHSTGIKCHMLLCLLALPSDKKIILHFRDILQSTLLLNFFKAFQHKKNIHWISNSIATAKALLPISSTVIYNGFNLERFKSAKNHELKTQLGLKPEQILVGQIGVLARWKGQVEFINAAALVLKKYPDYHFVIIGEQIYDTSGDTNYKNTLIQLIESLNISDRIHLLGFSKNIEKLLNSLDLCVHASIRPEPFGRIAVEAMLCKTPILASASGGILEIIRQGETGYLHRPGDIKDLSEKIILAINNDKKNQMTEKAYDFCKRSYSLENYYQELKKFFN